MQLGSKKRQLEGGLFRSNEEVEVIIREWLRMQESISLTTEYFIWYQDEKNTLIYSVIVMKNTDTSME